MKYSEIFQTAYMGNTVLDLILSGLFLTIGLLFHKVMAGLLVRLISQLFKKSEFRLTIEEYKNFLLKPVNFLLLLIFLFLSANQLTFPESLNLAPADKFGLRMFLRRSYGLLVAIALTRIAVRMVSILGEMLKKKQARITERQDNQLITFAIEVGKIIIIIISILLSINTVFDLNVGSLVAGLGIGGLAIALAAKDSLENLFGSFTIFFDKPFVVGDIVKVADIEGVVEKVGFRSTRIRTLEKSYLTIPNKKMIDAELDNLSLRTFRRVKFSIGLTYGTKRSEMQAVTDEIRKYITGHELTTDEVHVRFTGFGPSSLDIMVLYHINTMDYDVFLKVSEEMYYRIMEIVEEKGCDFAFPTQTIHLKKNE